jgi:NADH-ubiquinone oxidoreductase chain 1
LGALIVLLERRLGYVHIRKGPNWVGFIGLFLPFSEAIKLFTREQYFPLDSNYLSYYFSPIFRFIWGMLVLFIYVTRLASNEIFSLSIKTIIITLLVIPIIIIIIIIIIEN